MRTGGCGYRLRRGGSGEDEREETQNDDEKRQDWVSINPSDDISVQGLGMIMKYFRHIRLTPVGKFYSNLQPSPIL